MKSSNFLKKPGEVSMFDLNIKFCSFSMWFQLETKASFKEGFNDRDPFMNILSRDC